MNNYEKFCKVFSYLEKHTYDGKYFGFNPTDTQKKMIYGFLDRNKERFGDDWMFKFLVFQFNRFQESENFSQMSWYVGKKAEENYKKRTESQLFYVDKFINKWSLKNPLRGISKRKPLDSDYFEQLRRRYMNKEVGFLNCMEIELYSEESKFCKECKNKKHCKN